MVSSGGLSPKINSPSRTLCFSRSVSSSGLQPIRTDATNLRQVHTPLREPPVRIPTAASAFYVSSRARLPSRLCEPRRASKRDLREAMLAQMTFEMSGEFRFGCEACLPHPPEPGLSCAPPQVCPTLTIVEPGSHPPNDSISFHLVNSLVRVWP